MKRFLFGFLAALFLILNIIPYLHILADQSMTDSQLKQVGAFALSSLITTGEATELDFSDYTDSDTDFLLALGELVVTGDPSGLVECGLEWLGDNIDDAYDSFIQSIRTWEYNNLPHSFYYWFIEKYPPYELAPSYNNIRDLSQPLRRLITPPDESEPSVNPDINYLTYIRNMNDVQPYGFFWKNLSSDGPYFSHNNNGYYVKSFPCYNYSWLWYQGSWNDNNSIIQNYYSNNGLTHNQLMSSSNILTLYINSTENNNYIGRIDNITIGWVIRYSAFPDTAYYECGFTSTNDYLVTLSSYNRRNLYSNFSCSYTGTLNQVFDYFSKRFRNINIYVDGDPWSLVSSNEPTYPIVIPGQLTIWNDQPLEYTFPQDTYLKLPDLTNIITNAINNSGVVMWSDIADCFVDVNGQTAVAVTKIVRNDYDNLYMEQYPYPAMLVGMTDQTKFNEHLLDDSHAYLTPMGTVVQETVNVLPSELVGVLAIGAILTIFAVIINRLLE